MGTRGLSELHRGQQKRLVSPAGTPGCLRHRAAPAACLLLTLALAGCGALGATLHTGAALQSAGYQNVSVNLVSGSGLPAGGLVSVSYSRGPAGNDQGDAQGAEMIVWDTFPGRFGAVAISKESGGCAGPVCATQSNEVASATYAQLAASFGPRPQGLDHANAAGHIAVAGWVIYLGIGLAIAIIVTAAIVLTVILRRSRSRPPGPPPWQPGPPPWQPGPPPSQPGPPGSRPTESPH